MSEELTKALRQFRVAAGYTQATAARELDYSTSKLLRIENGQTAAHPYDVERLLTLYGVTDADVINGLLGLARANRAATGPTRRGMPTPFAGVRHSPPPMPTDAVLAMREELNDIRRQLADMSAKLGKLGKALEGHKCEQGADVKQLESEIRQALEESNDV